MGAPWRCRVTCFLWPSLWKQSDRDGNQHPGGKHPRNGQKYYDALETDTNLFNTVPYIVKQNTTQISKWLVLVQGMLTNIMMIFTENLQVMRPFNCKRRLPQAATEIATDFVLFSGLKSMQHKHRKKVPIEFTANTKYSLVSLRIAVKRKILIVTNVNVNLCILTTGVRPFL